MLELDIFSSGGRDCPSWFGTPLVMSNQGGEFPQDHVHVLNAQDNQVGRRVLAVTAAALTLLYHLSSHTAGEKQRSDGYSSQENHTCCRYAV